MEKEQIIFVFRKISMQKEPESDDNFLPAGNSIIFSLLAAKEAISTPGSNSYSVSGTAPA
jgi:hypothetical protein